MTEKGTELQPLRETEAQKEEVEILEDKAPEDKGNIVFLIILLHGIGTLMPWNMFLNISYDYYETYKMLDNATINTETGAVTGSPSAFSSNFQSYQMIAAQVPNLLLNFVNIFVVVKGSLVKRIAASLTVVATAVILTITFIYVDTASWLTGFFLLTIVTIIILNGANGIYQNSIFGLASDFPFKYTNAVIIGNNLCGTFVTLLSMLTKALTRNVLDRAFAYFAISLVTLGCCFASFFVLKTKDFFRYHTTKAQRQRAKNEDASEEKGLATYIDTFKQALPQLINVFLVFFVTLAIFPGLMMYVKDEQYTVQPDGTRTEGPYEFPVPKQYFMDMTTFLLFNVFAFIGALVAGKVQYPAPERLWIPVYARLLFIPFFAMCNYLPADRSFPVWFSSTWIFVLVGILMSLGSGYFSGLAMMYTPRSVDPSRAQTAGMMAGFFLIFGIVAGLLFTMVVKAIILYAGPLSVGA